MGSRLSILRSAPHKAACRARSSISRPNAQIERRAAERAVQQADAAYEAAVRQIETDVLQAYATWQAAVQIAEECSGQMMEESASILESRRLSYLRGDSSLLDYLLSVRVYNDTAQQCIEARTGLATAAANLFRALGL